MTRKEAVRLFIESANHFLDIKVREVGSSNRGEWVDKFNKYANAPLGSPWCAAFVSYAGGTKLGTNYTAPITADCDVLLGFARRRKILHSTGKAGDLFLRINAANINDANHTGLVTGVLPKGNGVYTIEGNTNDEGSREGYEVCKRTRLYSDQLLFVRWADLLDDTAEEDEGKAAWRVLVGANQKVLPGIVEENRVFVDLSDLAAILYGAKAKTLLGWSAEEGGVLWDRKPLPSAVTRRLIEGETYVAVRPAGDFFGLDVDADAGLKTVKLLRKAA